MVDTSQLLEPIIQYNARTHFFQAVEKERRLGCGGQSLVDRQSKSIMSLMPNGQQLLEAETSLSQNALGQRR